MLNSEGGVLVWGAPKGERVPGRKEKVFKGALTPVAQQYERDQIISTITQSITPMPVGILVQILRTGNKFIYIFEVQPSAY